MVQREHADSQLLNNSDKDIKLFYKQYCKLRKKKINLISLKYLIINVKILHTVKFQL